MDPPNQGQDAISFLARKAGKRTRTIMMVMSSQLWWLETKIVRRSWRFSSPSTRIRSPNSGKTAFTQDRHIHLMAPPRLRRIAAGMSQRP
jgi:hypothetical protein